MLRRGTKARAGSDKSRENKDPKPEKSTKGLPVNGRGGDTKMVSDEWETHSQEAEAVTDPETLLSQ